MIDYCLFNQKEKLVTKNHKSIKEQKIKSYITVFFSRSTYKAFLGQIRFELTSN